MFSKFHILETTHWSSTQPVPFVWYATRVQAPRRRPEPSAGISTTDRLELREQIVGVSVSPTNTVEGNGEAGPGGELSIFWRP